MTDDNQADAADLTAAFREAFRHHPSGVAVISADPGDGPVALTVGSLISISATPPTVAFSLSDLSSSSPAILRAETMVVHFLRIDDVALARLGAQRGADRFAPGTGWARLPGGEPYFPQVHTWFRARQRQVLPLEGATIVVAELISASHPPPDPAPEDSSIVYLDRRWHGLRRLK